MRRSPNWQSNTLRGYRMLLKEFYIDNFIKRIEQVKKPSDSDISDAWNAGLMKAIHILEQIKEESHNATQQ